MNSLTFLYKSLCFYSLEIHILYIDINIGHEHDWLQEHVEHYKCNFVFLCKKKATIGLFYRSI